jgi:hypothetical protein
MYLNIMLNQVCVASGRQGMWTWLMVGATIVNPALNAALIPVTQRHFGNGAVGAAIALAATEFAIAVAGFVIVGRRVIGLSMVTRGARMLAACGCMWAILYATRGAGAYASVAFGCAGLLVAIVLFGAITRTEQRAVIGMAAKLARRVAPGLWQTKPDPKPRDSRPPNQAPAPAWPPRERPVVVKPAVVKPAFVKPAFVKPAFANAEQSKNGSARSPGRNASSTRVRTGIRVTAVSLAFAVVLIRVMTPARRAALLSLLLSAPRRVKSLPRLARTLGRRRVPAGASGSERQGSGVRVVVQATKPKQIPWDETTLEKLYSSKREGTNGWNVDV